ncbi:hypothetical protein J7E99_38605 [Streptomyces sp. ISL-44]|uniref:hypothetical protein n=1 Tax=Streptomyces sp. ISL-44 TaxID=2819184 RepID=UPI001BECACC3|nr:hypothetical protein [Streptomyces sp. ISL-44]MBT2546417.1 hypothetical protein [Streptomyces sp. ISL-44]
MPSHATETMDGGCHRTATVVEAAIAGVTTAIQYRLPGTSLQPARPWSHVPPVSPAATAFPTAYRDSGVADD